MNQPSSGPSDSGQNPVATRSLGFALQTELIPITGRQQHTMDGALRLLATWAVRAARARVAEQVSLDSLPPGSDECTPNPSPGEDMT